MPTIPLKLLLFFFLRFPLTPKTTVPFRSDAMERGENGRFYFRLNSGHLMPAIGFGTWRCKAYELNDVLNTAIQVGYRHIDCASVYKNEHAVGAALKEIFSNGQVKREDLWITSKLWSADHAPEDVEEAVDKTLADLQLQYLDLYIMHWPVRLKKGRTTKNHEDFAPLDLEATWRAMERLVTLGKVRCIGTSNFSTKKLQSLVSYAEIMPAVNQVECHPLWQQKTLRAYCISKGIHMSAYSPLGCLNNVSAIQHPIVVMAAQKLNRTPAQVALRWGLQSGNSVLTKSGSSERVISNYDVFEWSIPEDIFNEFSKIEQVRLLQGETWLNESTSPYRTLEELWDGEI